MTSAVVEALARHGIDMTPHNVMDGFTIEGLTPDEVRCLVAIHEAGHAIVAHVSGCPLRSITIDVVGSVVPEYGRTSFFPHRHDRLTHGVVSLAGPAAMLRAERCEAVQIATCEHSFDHDAGDPMFPFVATVTRENVRAYFPAILHLARRIGHADGILEGDELTAALAEAMGTVGRTADLGGDSG
jgi:hypothetical protein